MNLESAFEIENALSFSGECFVATGTDPAAIALASAPVGSLYLDRSQATARLVQKATDIGDVAVFSSSASVDTDRLVYDVAKNYYVEVLPTTNDPTSIIFWETSDKLSKIREVAISYTNNLPTTVTETQYSSGSFVEKMTYTLDWGFGDAPAITAVKSLTP